MGLLYSLLSTWWGQNWQFRETKEFLSSIETKNEQVFLTLSEISIRYVIVYSATCDTNILDLDPALSNHKQEEADTSIVLHEIDVTRRNPFADLTISFSDTDVLLIQLHYFV